MQNSTVSILHAFDEQARIILTQVQKNFHSEVIAQFNKMAYPQNMGFAKSRVKQHYRSLLSLSFLSSFANNCTIDFSYGLALEISKQICKSVSKASLHKLNYTFSPKKAGRNKAKKELEQLKEEDIALMKTAFDTSDLELELYFNIYFDSEHISILLNTMIQLQKQNKVDEILAIMKDQKKYAERIFSNVLDLNNEMLLFYILQGNVKIITPIYKQAIEEKKFFKVLDYINIFEEKTKFDKLLNQTSTVKTPRKNKI